MNAIHLFVFVVVSMTWRRRWGKPTGVVKAPLNAQGEKKV